VLLTPIVPARAGNGLAMRAWLFRVAAALDFQVQVVVVPVADGMFRGVGRAGDGATTVVASRPGGSWTASDLTQLLAEPRWRRLLTATYPPPLLARGAPPTLAEKVIEAARIPPGVPIHEGHSKPLRIW